MLLTSAAGFAIDDANNSLSDVYEFIYFGGSSAFVDPDADGVTTYDEMFRRTNPTTRNHDPHGATLRVLPRSARFQSAVSFSAVNQSKP